MSEIWVCFLCVLGGDTILAEQDLHILTEILRPVAPRWRNIGGSLGILDSDLTIIQHNPVLIQEGTTGYLREMLSQWLKWAPPNHPSPTLETLAVALQKSGDESLAANLNLMVLQRKGWFVYTQVEISSLIGWSISKMHVIGENKEAYDFQTLMLQIYLKYVPAM